MSSPAYQKLVQAFSANEPYYLASVAECQKIDAATIAAGAASIALIKEAGGNIFTALQEQLTRRQISISANFLILLGSGNNAADGLIVAEALINAGHKVKLLCSSTGTASESFKKLLYDFINKHQVAFYLSENADLLAEISQSQFENIAHIAQSELSLLVSEADVIIDALLGIGQKSAPRSPLSGVLAAVAAHSKKSAFKLAIDVPTGLNADTGEVFENCFQADACFCIGYVKRGLLQYSARQIVKELKVLNISWLPHEAPVYQLNTPPDAQILVRPANSHKADYGRILVIAGSKNMPGAATLVANAALNSGAGLVTKVHCQNWSLAGLKPEVMLLNLGAQNHLCAEHLTQLKSAIAAADCLVIGPGIGQDAQTAAFIEQLLPLVANKKKIIDADALNIIAKLSGQAFDSNTVLTPHPGEAARLLAENTETIERDRYAAAQKLHEKYQATVILKGAATIIKTSDRGYVNVTGNSNLATAGSGDKLAGMIAALMARGISAEKAACFGVFKHGELAELSKQSPWFN